MKIDKTLLHHLAELARLDVHAHEDKLRRDLENIVSFFQELQSVDTESVPPLTGGADVENVVRDDADDTTCLDPTQALRDMPNTKDGFLKVPPVFE